MLKGEYSEKGGQIQAKLRRKKTLKRIREYEKFEANCLLLKELEETKKQEEGRRRKSLGPGDRGERVVVLRKARSVSAGPPPCLTLASRLYLVSLLRHWRARAAGGPGRPRAASLAPDRLQEVGARRRTASGPWGLG